MNELLQGGIFFWGPIASIFHYETQGFTSKIILSLICLIFFKKKLCCLGLCSTALKTLPISQWSWHVMNWSQRLFLMPMKKGEWHQQQWWWEQQQMDSRFFSTSSLFNFSNLHINDMVLALAWHLRFSYDHWKKSFFIDGHERPNIIFHHNKSCKALLPSNITWAVDTLVDPGDKGHSLSKKENREKYFRGWDL